MGEGKGREREKGTAKEEEGRKREWRRWGRRGMGGKMGKGQKIEREGGE